VICFIGKIFKAISSAMGYSFPEVSSRRNESIRKAARQAVLDECGKR
jgi:hypothetical protein